MRAFRGFSYLILILVFCVGAIAQEKELQEKEPRRGEMRFGLSSESRIVTLAADNTVVAVGKADRMPGNRELAVTLDRTVAVVMTRSGDVFMRAVAINDRGNGELRLLVPYSEEWDIDRVIISGLQDAAATPRTVAFSREQLLLPADAKGSGITTNVVECFANGDNWRCDICFVCHTYWGVELCGNPFFLGGGDC